MEVGVPRWLFTIKDATAQKIHADLKGLTMHGALRGVDGSNGTVFVSKGKCVSVQLRPGQVIVALGVTPHQGVKTNAHQLRWFGYAIVRSTSPLHAAASTMPAKLLNYDNGYQRSAVLPSQSRVR